MAFVTFYHLSKNILFLCDQGALILCKIQEHVKDFRKNFKYLTTFDTEKFYCAFFL